MLLQMDEQFILFLVRRIALVTLEATLLIVHGFRVLHQLMIFHKCPFAQCTFERSFARMGSPNVRRQMRILNVRCATSLNEKTKYGNLNLSPPRTRVQISICLRHTWMVSSCSNACSCDRLTIWTWSCTVCTPYTDIDCERLDVPSPVRVWQKSDYTGCRVAAPFAPTPALRPVNVSFSNDPVTVQPV